MSLNFICTHAFTSKFHKEYMLPLLRRWNSYFRQHEKKLDLDTYDWMELGRGPIHEVLIEADKLPRDLSETLMAISEMSTTEGYNTIIESAASNGWDLGERPFLGWSPQDMAAKAFMERPALFEQAMATVRVRHTTNWLDYFDTERGDVEQRVNPALIAKLESRLKDYWRGRMRAPFAEVRPHRVGSTYVFLIARAELTKTQVVITSGNLAREVVYLDPEVTDTVAYSRETGRLSVSTRFKTDASGLAKIFGEVLYNDPARYQEFTTYCGAPLILLGSKALQPRLGKFTVRVKACTLVDLSRSSHRVTIQGAQAGEELDGHLTDAVKRGLTLVKSLSLAFKFEDRRAEVTVTLDDKNKVSVPRHLIQSEEIYRFLVDMEFAVTPEKGARR